jgi:hypothetical protein
MHIENNASSIIATAGYTMSGYLLPVSELNTGRVGNWQRQWEECAFGKAAVLIVLLCVLLNL